jgi:hypothetical protein
MKPRQWYRRFQPAALREQNNKVVTAGTHYGPPQWSLGVWVQYDPPRQPGFLHPPTPTLRLNRIRLWVPPTLEQEKSVVSPGRH